LPPPLQTPSTHARPARQSSLVRQPYLSGRPQPASATATMTSARAILLDTTTRSPIGLKKSLLLDADERRRQAARIAGGHGPGAGEERVVAGADGAFVAVDRLVVRPIVARERVLDPRRFGPGPD